MKRIFEPAAYAPRAGCWWDETVSGVVSPRLESDVEADVAIIGAGFTGLTAARTLAEAGIDTVVLEAEEPGFGASGRNGGFCCLGGGKLSWPALVRRFGDEGARDWAHMQRDAVTFVADVIDRNGLDVDRCPGGETVLAHNAKAFRALADEADHTRQVYGVEPELLTPTMLAERGMRGAFHGGLTTPIGFGLNPAKYLSGLLNLSQNAGARVHGKSPVLSMSRVGPGWQLQTPEAVVRARRVILATNGYSSEDVPHWLRARTMPVQSRIIVTRPLSDAELEKQGWTSHQMAYDSRFLLHYFRLLPDKRFLFGMRGGLTLRPSETRHLHRKIRRDFNMLFPHWSGVDITHDWSGLVCLMRRLLPFVGPVRECDGVFASLGYHGNGVAMGSYCGALVARSVLGQVQSRELRVVGTEPLRFPLNGFRRSLLRPVYTVASMLDL